MPNFRILSCDGGGIRGVLSAVLLNRLSAAYPNLLQDRPDTISMYAGTSTGGILALGLAAGLTPAQIRDLYVTDGKLIFDSSWTRDVVELGGLSGSKYDNVNLKQILQENFGAEETPGPETARSDRVVQPGQSGVRSCLPYLEPEVLSQLHRPRQRRRFSAGQRRDVHQRGADLLSLVRRVHRWRRDRQQSEHGRRGAGDGWPQSTRRARDAGRNQAAIHRHRRLAAIHRRCQTTIGATRNGSSRSST